MPRKWSDIEDREASLELRRLYIEDNKSITEIGKLLGVSYRTIYKRLRKFNIETVPQKKAHYRNKRAGVKIPANIDASLAEFLGIMSGDGQLTHFQVKVTLGSKEQSYAEHVAALMNKIFCVNSSISTRRTGYRDVYFGSVDISSWLFGIGLVKNKVKEKINVPPIVAKTKAIYVDFIRGFFDTDGSVYRIKHGVQISFTNYSMPLLASLRKMLAVLQYKPSAISSNKVYLTKKEDVLRFFMEIKPKNVKHVERFKNICAGVRVVK